jgi:acyl-CoA thioester hydrolase
MQHTIFSHNMAVRWREMDALGHVNNAQYLSYVEETRLQWFDALQSDWQAQSVAPIVAAIHIDFRKPLLWPEKITVSLYATKKGTKSVTIGHRIVSTDNAELVYAEGYTVMVWVDKNGQTSTLPNYISTLFD